MSDHSNSNSMLIFYQEIDLLQPTLGLMLTEFTVIGFDVLILLTKQAYNDNTINHSLDAVKYDKRTRMTRNIKGSIEWDNSSRIDWCPLTATLRGMRYHHVFLPIEAKNDPVVETEILPCLRR